LEPLSLLPVARSLSRLQFSRSLLMPGLRMLRILVRSWF
jgi:hypothetical protein